MLEQEEEDAGKQEEGATWGINQKVPGCPGRPCAPSVWCGAGGSLCGELPEGSSECYPPPRAHFLPPVSRGGTQAWAPKGLDSDTAKKQKQKPVTDGPYHKDLSQ